MRFSRRSMTSAGAEGREPEGRSAVPTVTDMQFPATDGVVTLTLTTEVYPEVTLGRVQGPGGGEGGGQRSPTMQVAGRAGPDGAERRLQRRPWSVAAKDGRYRRSSTSRASTMAYPSRAARARTLTWSWAPAQFVPGFEEQIVGMSAGEEKDIDITFPEDYHKELAGKAVVFHVKLNKVTETMVSRAGRRVRQGRFRVRYAGRAEGRHPEPRLLEKAKEAGRSSPPLSRPLLDKAAENTTVDMPEGAGRRTKLDIQMERFGYQLQMSGILHGAVRRR